MDNQPSTLREMALFAGAGGGILGGHLLGWKTVCAVEWEPYPASVLVARQNDGILPPFPIWDDVQTFDGKPWRGLVDVVSGGFPCQDISSAGKGAGIDGERSGMWSHMARIIGEVRPRYAFIENSPMLTIRGLDRVLCDLAAMGYDAEWGVISASDCGAPHKRDRIWIVCTDVSNAKSAGAWQNFRGLRGLPERCGFWPEEVGESHMGNTSRLQRNGSSYHAGIILESGQVPESGNNGGAQNVADTNSAQRKGDKRTIRGTQERANTSQPSWWASEPDVG